MSTETIEQEWQGYLNHFEGSLNDSKRHAFYMGVLNGLFFARGLDIAELRAVADELDKFMDNDPCECEACAHLRANGLMPTMSQRLGLGESTC